MDKIVYFDKGSNGNNRCFGKTYFEFIDYAFSVTDFFMLVYVNYYGKGYTKMMKDFMKELKQFEVKRRTNPSWPGVLCTVCPNTTYKIVFYRADSAAKDVLKKVDKISDWTSPSFPQDLAFFKGDQCWFYSVGHEKIASVIHATKEDISFLEKHGLAYEKDVKEYTNYYDQYDEDLTQWTVRMKTGDDSLSSDES